MPSAQGLIADVTIADQINISYLNKVQSKIADN